MAGKLMIQGAGSNVGKSLLVAGLCRAYANRGLRVRPFKPQNMSNNAAVTEDGGEIGRAQALQALACRASPHSRMNPVLLKPESESGAQIILQGKRLATLSAAEYTDYKPKLLDAVVDSFRQLSDDCDLVLIEGAGSPAETNLRKGDIANMGFAAAVNAPVILTGDIDRGGVIAQMVGTFAVLDPADCARIKGFVINKFRGDPALFKDGLTEIAARTGWHDLGVLPWFDSADKLPAEDILDIRSSHRGPFKIAVLKLSRIANFDDLDPLRLEPNVSVVIVEPGAAVPGDAQVVIIPGSKSTIADMNFLRRQGWDVDIQAHVRRGGHVLGICGGYQMLGKTISDSQGTDGKASKVKGLGLLNVDTRMAPTKQLAQVTATDIQSGQTLHGYEIHMGHTVGPDCDRPWLTVDGRTEGATSADGRVRGSYVHGLFSSDGFRQNYLGDIGIKAGTFVFDDVVDKTLDDLAAHLESALDLNMMLQIAAQGG